MLFQSHIELFNEPLKPIELAELEEFKTLIFEGVDTRGRIAVVNKCLLLHDLLNEEKKKVSHLYMCAEILLVMADQLEVDLGNEALDKRRTDAQTRRDNKYVEDGLVLLNNKFYTDRGNNKYLYTEGTMSLVNLSDLWSHLLVICRYLRKKNDHWRNVGYAGCDLVALNRYCDDFLNLLKSIN